MGWGEQGLGGRRQAAASAFPTAPSSWGPIVLSKAGLNGDPAAWSLQVLRASSRTRELASGRTRADHFQ